MRGGVAVGLIGAACSFNGAAHAADPAERAGAMFAQGREAMKRGEYAVACLKFTQSQELDASLGTLLNLSVCEAHQGHLVRAGALLRQFLNQAALSDDRRASAQQLAEEIALRIPHLLLRIEPKKLAEVRLVFDGRARDFATGAPLYVDPGKHDLDVTAAGYVGQRITIDLGEAELVERLVLLKPVAASNSGPRIHASKADVRRAEPGLPRFFYVALGTGLAGALTVAGSSVLVARERSTVQDHCFDKSCDSTGLAAGRRGKTFVAVNTVAWAVAVAGASLALYIDLARDQRYTVHVTANPLQPSVSFEGKL